MSVANVKWYKTTGGKVLMVLGITAAVTGIVVAINKFKKAQEPTKKDIEEAVKRVEEATKPLTEPKYDNLPKGGLSEDVKTDFDRVYNYIKVSGSWWTISKDKVKIPEWKSLADNKAATDLLNNKYPS